MVDGKAALDQEIVEIQLRGENCKCGPERYMSQEEPRML